jgi:hypothetical protein
MKNPLSFLRLLAVLFDPLFLTRFCTLYVTNTDSTQMATINSASFDQLKPNEAHGRLRTAFFYFTTLATGGADGDSYNLNKIPKGARVLRIETVNEALGSSVVAKIGITSSLSKYGSAVDMAAAGADLFCQTVATHGLVTTAEETLIMTLTGAAPAASKIVQGHVTYVVD